MSSDSHEKPLTGALGQRSFLRQQFWLKSVIHYNGLEAID